MAVFLVFWISPAVNPTKSFKNLAEKGYRWFFEPFAMLFMQLQGLLILQCSPLIRGSGTHENLEGYPGCFDCQIRVQIV
jgi:hypothetical protein